MTSTASAPDSRARPPALPPGDVDLDGDDISAEPPPAYSAHPGGNGVGPVEQTVAAGPSRMNFSGPPPVPEWVERQQQQQLQQQYTGGSYMSHSTSPPHTSSTSWSAPLHPPPHLTAHFTGTSASSFPPPPQRVPPTGGRPLAAHATGTGAEGDITPTQVATPGRPLLREGKFLIYPVGHLCKKCYNMGYKNNDPGHPCKNCWSKYGKPYTSAIAHSWPRPSSSASTSTATNYQRPLPNFRPPQAQPTPPPPHHQGYPGAHMGRAGYPHPPPQPHPPAGYMGASLPHIVYPGSGPMMPHLPQAHYGYGPPPGAIVVQPGDPRIGGMICQRCYGQGTVPAFFGFDDEQCWACRGVGRVF